MKQSKIVIWDLMGGGCNSLRLALKKSDLLKKYKVYTFDIVRQSNGFKNIVLDLSTDNIVDHLNKMIESKRIAKPDFIISSPLCQSFSVAMQSVSTLKDKKGNFFSGNPHHFWNYDIEKVCRWPKNKNITWNGFSGNSYSKGSKSVPKYVGELGERCIQNIIRIICNFKPKCWYIENPALSLMWKFIKFNLGFDSGYLNIAHYSAYNSDFSKKPTGFLSNINLNLKKQEIGKKSLKQIDDNHYLLVLSGACKDNKKDEEKRVRVENFLKKQLNRDDINVKIHYKKNAMERSHIPEELLLDIINKFSVSNNKPEKYKCANFKLTQWSDKKKPGIKKMVKEVSI